MALRSAFQNEALRALEGKWVRLFVNTVDYSIEEVSREVADAYWEAHRPAVVQVPGARRDVREFVELSTLYDAVDFESGALREAVKVETRAVGGKAAHYGALLELPELRVQDAFAVPLVYYFEHMERHGLDARVRALLASTDFTENGARREDELMILREEIALAPIDADLLARIETEVRLRWPGQRIRFRSSTNAEDLDGFTGAGLYESKTGDPDDPSDPLDEAIKEVWASVFNHRAQEERTYRGISHLAVGMALLVHPAFPDEEANGVALTNNPFDQTGAEPAFFINVQVGETSVVQPPAGVTTDSFLYHFDRPGRPMTFLTHSNQVAAGHDVLTPAQTLELGTALAQIRAFFRPAYDPGDGSFWAMDVELKFDVLADGQEARLFIKQARPYR